MYTTSITPEMALSAFMTGVDCSQVVFAEFATQFGIDRETALKISANFGGGMSEGATCGAVVGALMALGLQYGQGDEVDPDRKDEMVAVAADFKARFSELYGSCICREMLGYKIPEEIDRIMAENKFATVCCHAVADACRICADLLNED